MTNDIAELEALAARWNTRSIADREKIIEAYWHGLAYAERCLPEIKRTLAASNLSNLPSIVRAAVLRFYREGGQ